MRGKDIRRRVIKPFAGITPAYAGKSARGVLFLSFTWDHPRLCGEKSEI